MNNNLPNGGFPPIIKCIYKKEKENKFSKERYGPENKKNINIVKILNTNTLIKKPILLEDTNKIEDLEEV